MTHGAYRCYFHIGSLGFKFPRYCRYYANPILAFLTGIIMNVLERKRYKYYVQQKPIKQWGKVWKCKADDIKFCPCYFTCGLFSVYKHLPYKCSYADLEEYAKPSDIYEFWREKVHWITRDIKDFNFRKDYDGEIYCVDYGDFVVDTLHQDSVINIDYK